MRYRHTSRPGFLLGFVDFFTAGLFFLLYMPLGGLQEELEEIRLMPSESSSALMLRMNRCPNSDRIDVLPPHTRDFSRELGGRAIYLQGLNLYGIN